MASNLVIGVCVCARARMRACVRACVRAHGCGRMCTSHHTSIYTTRTCTHRTLCPNRRLSHTILAIIILNLIPHPFACIYAHNNTHIHKHTHTCAKIPSFTELSTQHLWTLKRFNISLLPLLYHNHPLRNTTYQINIFNN